MTRSRSQSSRRQDRRADRAADAGVGPYIGESSLMIDQGLLRQPVSSVRGCDPISGIGGSRSRASRAPAQARGVRPGTSAAHGTLAHLARPGEPGLLAIAGGQPHQPWMTKRTAFVAAAQAVVPVAAETGRVLIVAAASPATVAAMAMPVIARIGGRLGHELRAGRRIELA